MKEFFKSFKSEFNECFGECSVIDIIRGIAGVIIVAFFLTVCCAADSLGPLGVIICIGICVLLWKVLGISKLLPDEDDEADEDE